MCSAFTCIALDRSSGAARMLKLGDTLTVLATRNEVSSREISCEISASVELGELSLTKDSASPNCRLRSINSTDLDSAS